MLHICRKCTGEHFPGLQDSYGKTNVSLMASQRGSGYLLLSIEILFRNANSFSDAELFLFRATSQCNDWPNATDSYHLRLGLRPLRAKYQACAGLGSCFCV